MKTILLSLTLILVAANSVFALTGFNPMEHFDRNKSNLEKHVSDIHKNASSLNHFDGGDYDTTMSSLEAFEADALEREFFEHVEKHAKNNPREKAKAIAYTVMSKKHGGKFHAALAKKAPQQMVGKSIMYDAQAMFDMIITRNTANIANISLPVPLFGAIHYNARYLSILPQYLPAGVVLSSIAIDASGNLNFTYTQTSTGFQDVVNVACAQVPYITFLDASKLNAQTIGKCRLQISDITKIVQFSQIFETYAKSLYGKHGGNNISLASTNDPKNYPNGARDVDQSFDTDHETALIVGIIPQAGFSVTMSMFVQAFTRTNRARI